MTAPTRSLVMVANALGTSCGLRISTGTRTRPTSLAARIAELSDKLLQSIVKAIERIGLAGLEEKLANPGDDADGEQRRRQRAEEGADGDQQQAPRQRVGAAREPGGVMLPIGQEPVSCESEFAPTDICWLCYPASLLGAIHQRRPPGLRDPHPRDLDRAPAGDHALGRHPREPAVDQLDHHVDPVAVRQHDRLGAAVGPAGEEFEGAAPSGRRDALARAVAVYNST
jgi:hypothetical protein